MSATFNVDEILEMAQEIERNGAKFYRKAAEGTAGDTSKDMLLRLAAMEDEHEKTFAEMRRGLSAKEQASTTFDPDGQAALYLQSIADGHVFDVKLDPAETLSGNETATEILKTAIGLEKDSIVFYIGIQDLVGETLGKDKVNDIIREEVSHISILSSELAEVQ